MEFEETEPQINADERRFAALYLHYSRSESHGKAIIESTLQGAFIHDFKL